MMKLNKFVYWLKKDKAYLTSANSAALSNAFLALNIITIVLNIILVIALFAVIMIKGKK